MKRFSIYIIVSICFFGVSCSSEESTNLSDTSVIIKKSILDYDTLYLSSDSLVSFCSQIIDQHFSQYQGGGESNNLELVLEGSVSYEDEEFTIVTFSEILKYGSWHYSESSFVFKKLKDNKLVRILPDKPDSTTGPNIDKSLAYYGRINGSPYEVEDLNANDEKDFIFESQTSVKATAYTNYSFYFQYNGVLIKSNLEIQSELEDGAGFVNLVTVVHDTKLPSISIETNEVIWNTENNQILKKSLHKKQERYFWNFKFQDFEQLKP